LVHGLVVVNVYVDRDLVDDGQRISQSLLEGLDDDNRVDVPLKLRQSLGKNLSRCAELDMPAFTGFLLTYLIL
jgi:hypothetical protein